MALSTTQYGYIIDPMVPFTDDKGKTIKNGFVRVFVAGSSTPVVTYRNFDGAANQDLIELDNSGRTKTSVIGSKGLTYKVCVYDKHHSQESPILTVDKVSVIGSNITAGTGATVVTGLDGLTTKPDGFVDASVVGTDGYVAIDHTLVTDDLDTDAKVTAVEDDRYVPLLNEDVNDPDSKITLGHFWKWVLGKISNIATSITDFRTGDVIPVDGPSGTAKMSKDDLLKVTAQNALAGNVAQLFDPTRTSENAYKAGDRVLWESNKIYVFETSHYGAWNPLDVVRIEDNDTTFEIFDMSSTNGCNSTRYVLNPTIGYAPRFGSSGSDWNLVCTKLFKGESIYVDYRYILPGSACKYIVVVNESTGLVTEMVELDAVKKYTATEDCIILVTLHYDNYNSRSAFAIISRHADEEKLHRTTAKYRINAPADNDGKYLVNGTIGGNVTMINNAGYAVAEETLNVGDELVVYYGGSTVGFAANQVQVVFGGSSVIDEILALQSSVTTYTATRPCKVYFSLHTDANNLAYYIIIKLSISSALTGLYNSASKSEGNPSIVCPKFIDVVDGVQNKNVIFPFDMLTSGNGLDGGYMLLKRSGSFYPLRVWNRRPYDFNLSSDTMTVKLIQNNVAVAQKTFSTRLVSGNSQPANTTAKICICGDSLIDNNYAASQAYKLLLADGYTIRQVGTKSIVYDGVTYKHEGHSGWKYADYIDVNKDGNPFAYNGAIDFKHYAESLLSDLPAGERVLDYFLVSLGTNDVGSDRAAAGLLTDATIAGLIDNAKAFIDYLKDDSVGFPSCKIAIGLPGLGALATNPVFGENIQKFNQALIDTFDDGSYASGVTCVCHGPYIYREESYQYTDIPINGYCTDTYRKPGDGIHPRDIGYQQWGFAYYAKLKSMLNGNL